MAISTFSFFLPLPFFAAAGGFGGTAAFGALGAFGAFGFPPCPAAPTKAKVLLRSSMAASEARALMIAWWLSLLTELLLLCRSRCVL